MSVRKREEIQKVLRRLRPSTGRAALLSLFSAALLSFSYPNFNIEFLAWFAFVPLFFALENRPRHEVFLLAYLAGLVFWSVTVYWLVYVSLSGFILLVLYLSLYFAVFGLLLRMRPVFAAAGWVALEYIRAIALTGFPWALLGYSQYLNIRLIQIADLVSVWGVSFLVMIVNLAVYSAIRRRFSVAIPTAIACLAIAFLYGGYRLNQLDAASGKGTVKISLIQGNIPQYQKWDAAFKDSTLKRYSDLTKEAAEGKPDLIIWPETALPGVIDEEPGLLAYVIKLARETKTPLLVGAVTARAGAYYNSAILISRNGKVLTQYDKLHLVPFGEYVPLEKKFPFLRSAIGVPIGDFKAGSGYSMFQVPVSGYRFGALVCFEDIFPQMTRRLKKDRADFLVNVTNDAWFMRTSAPYQHAQASVFRAVENRIPVVRAANTGFSCFIDQCGRIYDKVEAGGKDIFVAGYRTNEIRVK